MRLQIDPVATAYKRLFTGKSEMDARTAAMASFGWEKWPGGLFTVTVDNAAQAFQNPPCRILAGQIARLGRKPNINLVLRFAQLPSLTDCGGDRELRAYIATASWVHAEVTDVDPALAARLYEVADDVSCPVPLRLAAKYAAAGDPLFSIAPASLSDEDIQAALTGNLLWRRDQPASVDMIVDDGDGKAGTAVGA